MIAKASQRIVWAAVSQRAQARYISASSLRCADGVVPPVQAVPVSATPVYSNSQATVEARPAVTNTYTGSSPPPPPPRPKRSRARKWVVRTARTTLVVILGTTSYVIYRSWSNRHPPQQLDYDPTKKRLVVLGNGWASTSFLKGIDTTDYNVTVVSPRNFFLFTPLLPSVTVGTVDARSILEPTRFITRHKARSVEVYEGEAESVDPVNKTVTFSDTSKVQGEIEVTTIPYDELVYAVGAENNTFGIPGVSEHACFLKEIQDAEKIRKKLMDCIETATFKDQPDSEIDRLLHMVVVGGGPTGVEYAAELHDFLVEDLQNWYPEIAGRVKITLVEALPSVLPMFSKQLIDYTTSSMQGNKIDVLTRTMVKKVEAKKLVALDANKNPIEIPYGLLVWATGNTARPVTKSLMNALGEPQKGKRGLAVDEFMKVAGADSIWALGDCTQTPYAPTAQAASQQGQYLARIFNDLAKRSRIEAALSEAQTARDSARAEKLQREFAKASKTLPFHYSHQGSLAYIGSEKAIADVPFGNGTISTGGFATMLFWRSAYASQLFSLRNRTLVLTDWVKTKVLGRDVSRN